MVHVAFSYSRSFGDRFTKNILAIISETLGLMDELVELSGTGLELQPGKLRALNESIIEEVERANKIIRNMNSFAHSVDTFIQEVDIGQIVTLMMDICKLDSASKNMKLRLLSNEARAIFTSPLFLQNLIYRIINFSLSSIGPEKEIRVAGVAGGDRGGVWRPKDRPFA